MDICLLLFQVGTKSTKKRERNQQTFTFLRNAEGQYAFHIHFQIADVNTSRMSFVYLFIFLLICHTILEITNTVG